MQEAGLFQYFWFTQHLSTCMCYWHIHIIIYNTFLRNGLQNVQVLVEEFGEKLAFKLHLHPLLGLQLVVVLQHQVVELLQLGVLLEHLLPPPLPDTRHTAVKSTVPHPQKGKNIFMCMCMYCNCLCVCACVQDRYLSPLISRHKRIHHQYSLLFDAFCT